MNKNDINVNCLVKLRNGLICATFIDNNGDIDFCYTIINGLGYASNFKHYDNNLFYNVNERYDIMAVKKYSVQRYAIKDWLGGKEPKWDWEREDKTTAKDIIRKIEEMINGYDCIINGSMYSLSDKVFGLAKHDMTTIKKMLESLEDKNE